MSPNSTCTSNKEMNIQTCTSTIHIMATRSVLLAKRARIHEQQPDSSSPNHLTDPPNLPTDIIMQILSSLSTQDLQNLRSLSKFWFNFWYNLISSPTFINTHLKHQPKQSHLLISTITKPTHINKTYLYRHFSLTGITNQDEEDFITLKQLNLPSKNSYYLQASCDGLVLLQNVYDPRQLHISNPVTNPSGILHLPMLDPGYECRNWVLFFDTSISRYKVFGIRSQAQYLFLTLDENVMKPFPSDMDWTVWTLNRPWLGLYVYVLSQILVVRNELHWLSILPLSDHVLPTLPGCYCVFSVDVQRKCFRKAKVPLRLANPGNPHEFKSRKRLHLLLEVKGLLHLTIVSKRMLEMYVLVDRRNCVWTKTHTICLGLMPSRPAFLGSFLLDNVCLVAVRGVEGKNLLHTLKVIIHDEDELLLFNLKTEKIRHIGFLSKDQKLCTPSFVYSSTLVGCTPDSD